MSSISAYFSTLASPWNELKKPTFFLSVIFAALVFVSHAGVAAAGSGPRHINVDSEGYAIDRYDPVAYFTEGRPVRGSKKLTASHEGAKYAFSSAENRARFVADPKKYTPQFGGYCAYGVVHGSKSDIDPELWEIVDGRLFFLINPGTKTIWKRKKETYIAVGDKAWPKIKQRN